MNSQLCETSKATSSFSVILGVCECFLVFLETPWTDSFEDVSVCGAGPGGNGGTEDTPLLTIC